MKCSRREKERERARRENIFSSSKQMVNVCAKTHAKRRRMRLQMRFGYRSNELKLLNSVKRGGLFLSLSFSLSHSFTSHALSGSLTSPFDSITGIFQRHERASVNGARFREGFTTISSEILNLLTNYFETTFYVRNWFAWNFARLSVNIPVS